MEIDFFSLGLTFCRSCATIILDGSQARTGSKRTCEEDKNLRLRLPILVTKRECRKGVGESAGSSGTHQMLKRMSLIKRR